MKALFLILVLLAEGVMVSGGSRRVCNEQQCCNKPMQAGSVKNDPSYDQTLLMNRMLHNF